MNPKEFRRNLRTNQTNAESTFWNLVRAKRFHQLKFRRQHTIGKYTVDFFCPSLNWIIELEGSAHDNLGQANYDDERANALKDLGYLVIRIDNEAILKNPENVIAYLESLL